jgi:hypothetical protein
MERRTIRDASSDPVPFSGQWALTDPLAEARGVPRRTLNGAVLGAMDWMPRAWTDARLAVPDDRAAAARRAIERRRAMQALLASQHDPHDGVPACFGAGAVITFESSGRETGQTSRTLT